jgi:hypothetical protein
MRHLLTPVVVIFLLSVAWASRSATSNQETLQRALVLAGLNRSNLPITLATAAPASASPGVEAWTAYDSECGVRIFVYTGSDMFRCASPPLAMRQCLLRLASSVVHEAWHLEHGRGEEEAYEVQIAFLLKNGAAAEHVKAVRLAQGRVLAAERRAAAAAR